jgi:N6-adenosine-specific RNA methylase IME4
VTRSHSVRSTFTAIAGRHSEKPAEFYNLVEALRDGPYLELFARERRPGWTCIGDQLPNVREDALNLDNENRRFWAN